MFGNDKNIASFVFVDCKKYGKYDDNVQQKSDHTTENDKEEKKGDESNKDSFSNHGNHNGINNNDSNNHQENFFDIKT